MVESTLKNLFASLQGQLTASLIGSSPISHPVEKGDYTENHWKSMLKKHLPSRYRVESAFVIDCEGNTSDQIDIVIFDNYFSPFLFQSETTYYIPAESVYAVFEVKQTLNKEYFHYTKGKIASVRNLHRTSADIISCGKTTKGREPGLILGGLLTTNNNWDRHLKNLNSIETEIDHLNLGCCANDKSWSFRDGKYIWNDDPDSSLLAFFMDLLHHLQLIGSVPAMDISSYYNGYNIMKKA